MVLPALQSIFLSAKISGTRLRSRSRSESADPSLENLLSLMPLSVGEDPWMLTLLMKLLIKLIILMHLCRVPVGELSCLIHLSVIRKVVKYTKQIHLLSLQVRRVAVECPPRKVARKLIRLLYAQRL